jgi:hypothetical protein
MKWNKFDVMLMVVLICTTIGIVAMAYLLTHIGW